MKAKLFFRLFIVYLFFSSISFAAEPMSIDQNEYTIGPNEALILSPSGGEPPYMAVADIGDITANSDGTFTYTAPATVPVFAPIAEVTFYDSIDNEIRVFINLGEPVETVDCGPEALDSCYDEAACQSAGGYWVESFALFGVGYVCSSEPSPETPDLVLAETTVEVKKGQNVTIAVESGTPLYTFDSTESNIAVAAISDNTVVVAGLAEGTTTVTVKDKNDKTTTIMVTVLPELDVSGYTEADIEAAKQTGIELIISTPWEHGLSPVVFADDLSLTIQNMLYSNFLINCKFLFSQDIDGTLLWVLDNDSLSISILPEE